MNAKVFTYPITIKETYLDTFGHINNAAYLTLFEEARWDIITQNGFGLQRIQETGIGPTILEIKLSFLKEIRLREKIIIETQAIQYDGKVGKMRQTMIRDGEICCQAEFLIGLFDLKQRKLIPPTKEWLVAVGIEA